jgi:hypothetical protein
MNQQRIEHIREGMLRGDSAARSQLQSSQFSIASVTPNEVRQMENRNPIAGGDQSFVALNLIPMDLARPYWEAQIEKAKQPPPEPFGGKGKQEPSAEQEEKERQLRAMVQAAEDAKDLAVENARRADDRAELIAVAHAQDRERYQQEVSQLGDALAEANTSLHAAASREQALVEERDAALEVAAGSGRDTAQAMQQAAAADAAERAASAEVLRLRDVCAGYKSAVDTFQAERDAALALAEEAAKERDAARAEIVELGIDQVELRDRAIEARAKLEGVEVAAADLRETVAAQEAEAETLRADLARARADIAAELDNHQKQKAVTLAAMRALFVDATDRLLTKESLAARKHQATAEKLRAWLQTFYPMHVETVRYAFRPIVATWAAVTGGDAGAMLDRLVAEHMEHSTRALESVLDAEDDDQRAAMFERVLRRWEDERADAVADAVVREGMAGNG